MDSPSRNMYDTFKDEIWKELGPLDPDWFETLTAQTLTSEGNISDQDELCANQEGNFKAPLDRTAPESQLFSTPKVFRCSRVVSPETGDEQLFTAEQDKETLPWTATQSPCLFQMSKEGSHGAKYGGIQQSEDSFDLLRTPQKSPVNYAKQISESLGAQIHPDISWTSSLNTPPALPSTLILTKRDASPCPLSPSTDKNVVFVRKLFPSLSNTSRVAAASPKNNDVPTAHPGVVSPVAGQKPETHDSPQRSLNQSESVWRPKLPDAIEDGDVRSTVASVLDGTEEVLSIFFTNSSSALRKVKTDRIKRKQIIPTKEHSDSCTNISTTNNVTSSEQGTADQEPDRLSSLTPAKTGDVGISQWSPLSLSEIPSCTADMCVSDNNPAAPVKTNFLSGQPPSDRPCVKITDSGFTKKKRKFVYTVEPSKQQVQREETQSQKMKSSPSIPDSVQDAKQLVKDETDSCSTGKDEIRKQGNPTEEVLPPSVQGKIQDLDISQLSRDFAQDFSQMPNPVTLSKVAEDTHQNGFSPSACLSALKQANQKARQTNVHHSRDGVSNRRSLTNQNNSINEGTISDSGFQSAVADITSMTASSFVLPSTENNVQTQLWTSSKTDIRKTTSSPSTSKETSDGVLQETDTKLVVKSREALGPGRESVMHIESSIAQLPSSSKGTADNINCIQLKGQVHGSLPEKTSVCLPSAHASGFKTASNKGIQILKANLERAKRLFEETEGDRTNSDRPIRDKHNSHESGKNAMSNSDQPLSLSKSFVDNSCQLTASQKADVTELCTLLEEADSQFEFTQCKTAKLKQHHKGNATSPQKVEKELDPDFLTGIDFDDSFNTDPGKHLAAAVKPDNITDGKTKCETSSITSNSTGLSSSSEVKKEKSSTEDVSSSSKLISEGSSSIMSDENKNLDRTGHTETSKPENRNPLMLGVGFKTAGGNVLRVSKKCLSKARALFADLEEDLLTSEKFRDKPSSKNDARPQQESSGVNQTVLHHKQGGGKMTCSDRQVTGILEDDATESLQNSKMDTTNCQGGFQMASGKGISISAKAMQAADAFFKDCDVKDTNGNMSVKPKASTEPTPQSVSHKKHLQKLKNVQGMKANYSKGPINEVQDVNARPAARQRASVQHNSQIHSFGLKNTLALTNTSSFNANPPPTAKAVSAPSRTASKENGSSAITALSNGGGFCTARGQNVLVSGDALKKAECILNDIQTFEGTINLKQRNDTVRTSHLASEVQVLPPKNGGFQTASGKGFTISPAALKKAKSLLNDCEGIEDKINEKPTQFKLPVPGPSARNRGFNAASGRPVAFSSEALQKATALFSDINFIPETASVSHTLESVKTQDRADKREKIHCGFSTAGGAEVHVSQKNVLKAKDLLKEFDDGSVLATAMQESDDFFMDCDIMDSKDGVPVNYMASTANVNEQSNEEKNLPNLKQDPRVTDFSEKSGSACETKLCSDEVEINEKGIKTMLDSTSAASLDGNPPVIRNPSPSLIESMNDGCSANTELSKGGSFCTASGKKVSVSDDALAKAKSLLSENATFDDTKKNLKRKDDSLPPQSGRFQTASGKGVAISSAALKKAKTLFSEVEGDEDKIFVKPTHSKTPVPGPPPRNHGFLSARGKPVALSSEALQKAKSLFSDICSAANIPAVSHTRSDDKKQDVAENMEKIHCGFSTAGGAKVHISQKNLLKAKNLSKEFDDCPISATAMQESDNFFMDCDMDGQDGASVKIGESVAPMSESVSEKKNTSKSKQAQRVIQTISENPGNGHSKFENVTDCEGDENQENMLLSEIHGKKITLDSTNAASLQGGFCTAGGKKVSVSAEAMAKAKSLLNEKATFEDPNEKLKPKVDSLPSQSGGFQTASGKGVAVSSAALKKAKALLSECEGPEDEILVKPTHSKTPAPGPPLRSHGFLAASGKPVAFSSEGLQKAKALFSDISSSAAVLDGSHTRDSEHKDAGNDTEKIHFGFSTAGGAKVHVSQKSLLKAKNLLNDLGDGERHDSSPHLSVVKDVKRTSHLTTASDKDVPTKESVPQEVKSSSSLQATDHETQNASACGSIFMKDKVPTGAFKVEGRITNLHDSPGEKMSSALDREINQASSSEGTEVKRTEESSVLYFESLNLSGCTETQQKFFAQEALDCTKALLDDENLAEQRLLVASQNVPLQDNPRFNDSAVEERKGKGKRPAEEPDMTGQPPLKRRLLEEFDRTVDGPRGSTLRPEKSSPSGVMKDRRVFKYSISLHPNITRPHRSGTNYVETRLQKTTPTQHSAPGDSRSAHAKMSTFVPPFLKSTKTESCNNTGLKDNIRAPSAFVPPFKKQRTVVQESFSKPQEEEDKQQHLFVMPCNRNTYVPPTKKTQSTTDVSGNKSKEDAEIVALADTTKDNVIENQNLPVGCKSEESAAEASSMEDTLSKSQDMFQDLHNIELARDMQDMRIRKKKRQNIRPLPGSLFLTKTSGVSRISLRISVNGKPPARYTQKELYSRGVHQHVCEVTSETAESFRFSLKQFVKREAFRDGGGVQLADGGWLIPSNDGTAGKEEFYRALCDSPGVDPKLISEEWVYNHYRWIVWKQASMERSFPETMGSLCLSPEQVLLQLKYRYDVEVDHSRRPALRKIMEKDDTAAKTLVLCVCGVVSRGHSPKRQSDTKTPGCDAKVETPSAVVWLTDGWYAIKAQLDEPLTAMLHKGRLAVGGKLIINGAQLVGSQDACSPLEAPDSLMLKICANSSRPARWDAKLGFHKDPRPFLLPVSSLFSNGGPVGCVDIVILRSYPIQWMERKPDGGVVFRSVRAEEKEARRYNSHKQKAMESLFAKIQAEFEKEEKGNKRPPRRRRTISRQDIASLQDGEELYEAVGDDPAYIQSHLSEQQLETLHAYRRSLMQRKQAELQDRYRRALENAEDREGSCPKRDVTPVWRLCIADSLDEPGSVYQLNLWRPPSDLQSLLKEGCRYKVYNLTTSEGKKHSGNTAVQLTGTKKTQFQDLQASQEWLSMHFQPRVSTHFVDLQNPDFQPLSGEVDLTGYVISVIDGQGFSPALYLADGNLNFLKVRCFSSLAQSGLEDVVKPRVLLALSNLQLRGQSTSPTPVVYAGDLTVFSTNPKEVHLQESLSQLRNLIQGQANFWQTAEEKLSNLIKSDGLSSVSSPALQTRTPASTEERRQDTKTSVTSQQPVRAVGSFTPVSRNRPAPNCSTEKDPASLKRRRALDYLSRIPSPPPLSLLGSVASPYIKKTFVPPRRSGTPSTLKTVQTPARKPVNSAVEDEWVNDEELAMIDTQALLVGDVV